MFVCEVNFISEKGYTGTMENNLDPRGLVSSVTRKVRKALRDAGHDIPKGFTVVRSRDDDMYSTETDFEPDDAPSGASDVLTRALGAPVVIHNMDHGRRVYNWNVDNALVVASEDREKRLTGPVEVFVRYVNVRQVVSY